MAYIDLDTQQMQQLEVIVELAARKLQYDGDYVEAHRAFRTLEAVRKAVPDDDAYEMIRMELNNGK
jgi:hypothetical protein